MKEMRFVRLFEMKRFIFRRMNEMKPIPKSSYRKARKKMVYLNWK